MATVGCCYSSCRVLNPWIELPSVRPHPSCGRSALFLRRTSVNPIVRSQVRLEDAVEIVHNKVLVAAAVSGVVGQLVKPFSRVFLNGNQEEGEEKTAFDLRAAIESGGFPSSHSSAVTATATSLLLERGFADSIFGMSVVYAALVMYDAQGVRREVGKHARVLNKKHIEARTNLGGSMKEKNAGASDRSAAGERQTLAGSVLTVEEMETMKEGVGHTEAEVAAGAILGISVSLFIYNFI